MRRLDLFSLECFVAVARAGSIAAAARSLDLAPSALSKRLSDLESRFGHALVDRGPNALRLTAAGETVRGRAERMIELARGIDQDLAAHDAGAVGEVRLAAVAAAVAGRLAADIAAFERAHPRIRLSLSESDNLHVARLVAEGGADLGVAADFNLPAGLEKAHFVDDPIWVIAPLGHPLMAGRPAEAAVAFEEAVEHDLISLARGASIESMVTTAAMQLDRSLRRHFTVERYDSLRSMVEAGLGVGFIRESGVKRYQASLRIEARPLADPWARRRLCVVWRKISALSRAAGLLRDHLARPDAASCADAARAARS